MSPELRVHLLPSLFDPEELYGGIAVMIDVLRASTTITHALAAGAKVVIPCAEVDTARELAANRSGEKVLLGGERDGKLIDGFDLDNSPLSYTSDAVADKTIIFTTTNGTRALMRSNRASRILIGAFVNINAVIQILLKEKKDIHLVCAGTDGQITAEDCLCAGAIAVGITAASAKNQHQDDTARMAVDFFKTSTVSPETFLEAMKNSLGGRNLRSLGFDADIECAVQWDRFDLVPEFFKETGTIQSAADVLPVRTKWVAAPA